MENPLSTLNFERDNPAIQPDDRKAPIGISIKEILDGDQRGKNGEVISGREAYVIAL